MAAVRLGKNSCPASLFRDQQWLPFSSTQSAWLLFRSRPQTPIPWGGGVHCMYCTVPCREAEKLIDLSFEPKKISVMRELLKENSRLKSFDQRQIFWPPTCRYLQIRLDNQFIWSVAGQRIGPSISICIWSAVLGLSQIRSQIQIMSLSDLICAQPRLHPPTAIRNSKYYFLIYYVRENS